ncbi:MAG: 8-amino-7-oxononanoate synthase [Pseudoxanthomonas suwonensis]|nr:8-amino-7-oxononanoate synthase [Pseudoxanthomonas suwonensis]
MPTPDPSRVELGRRIAEARAERAAQGRMRQRRSISRRDGVRVEVDGRWLVGFCSNDYLGLSQQFAITGAAQDQLQRDGTGSTGSHLVCGHQQVHDALENEVADWLQVPRALLFGNGYLANLGVVQALLGEADTCVQDRLNHASLLDAARLAGCRLRRYPHTDPEGALRQLKAVRSGAALLATDGVFSMDGDVAPLRQLALATRMQRAWLYVDDAHGIGVLGPDGRGSVAAARLDANDVPLQMITLGKALGGYGAVVAGAADAVEHLAQHARSYIYTTALPPAQAAAALAAVRLARREQWRRDRLTELVARLRAGAARHGLPLAASDTPIQILPCGSEARALAMSAALERAGFLVPAIRPPTVPTGGSRLRISLSAAHGPEQIDALVEALAAARALSPADARTDA